MSPGEITNNDLADGIVRPDKRTYGSMGNIIDSEVIIRLNFQEDRRKGFELLFKRYYQVLCSHAVRFVYSRSIAEDIVMDVFSRFWQNRIYEAITTSYRSYLFTTVRHAAFAYLKSEFGKEHHQGALWDINKEVETPATPQQLLQYHELHNKIEEVLRSVSPQSQKVFLMSRFEGKKNQQIAEELDLSLKTVEGHITKALSVLRRSLRESGFISAISPVAVASALDILLPFFTS